MTDDCLTVQYSAKLHSIGLMGSFERCNEQQRPIYNKLLLQDVFTVLIEGLSNLHTFEYRCNRPGISNTRNTQAGQTDSRYCAEPRTAGTETDMAAVFTAGSFHVPVLLWRNDIFDTKNLPA